MKDKYSTISSPEIAFETKGYSAKHTFMVIFSLAIATGIVGIVFYIVIRLLNAIDEHWLEIAGISFLFLILTLMAIGGGTAIVYTAKALTTPGRQLPGRLGDWEERIERW